MENKTPPLNREQEAAAFCNDNAVIAAGAGSGKTKVLASRFAWLITEKNLKVNEILTLTFTTKAAAQMYSRIHSLLAEIAVSGTDVKAQRARQALDDFINARIQTLDSYSSALVRQSSHRYGISPNFKIDQERCRDIALELSLPFLIAHRRHPAVERLYSGKRPKEIIHGIFNQLLLLHTRIDQKPDLKSDVKKQFNIACDEWTEQCAGLFKLLKEIEDLIINNEALLPELVPLMGEFKNGKIPIPSAVDIRIYFNFLLEVSGEECIEKAESHPLQNSIMQLLGFITAINKLNLGKGIQKNNPVKERINQLRSLFGEFSSLAVFCLQAGFILSIMPLLETLQYRYLERKRAEKVLTFADVASLARTILLEQEDIRKSEKESFKAIMIDEFQDNNELQKDLLFLLAEKPDKITRGIPEAEDLSPGKLFFVGDEKQSIYLFRGADVSVFRKLKKELNSADLPLKINYRSTAQLIGAFNAIFGGSGFDPQGILPMAEKPSVFAHAGELPLYEAAYTPLQANRSDEGKFAVCILDTKTNGSQENENENLQPDENEAHFVAGQIRRLLEEKTEAGSPKYQPGDIAILFRKRSPQHIFEKHLRLLDIPYTSEDLNDIFYGGPVNDIMSVFRLAAYPMDSAAYAEMLRSPFSGLSLSGLALCLSVFKKSENPEPFGDEALILLDEADRSKYENGKKVYELICARAAVENVSSLISELWYNLGYRYECEWNPQASVYRQFYDYLFHLAVKADAAGQGLAAFTDSIIALRESGERLADIEIPLERPGAVHLLTIHKSKGLEFPVVFLCCCGKRSRTGTDGDVYFADDAGIVLNPPLPPQCSSIPDIRNNFFWMRTSAEIKRKRTAELRRLLYVGMTRAEKELYLTGCLGIGVTDDNFTVSLNNYIEEKANADKNIAGDSIIDDDTFFGLFLPALCSHIPLDANAGKPAFFSLEEIPVYSEEFMRSQETQSSALANNREGLMAFFEKFSALYKNAEVIQTPVLRDNHITPVSLKGKKKMPGDEKAEAAANRAFSGEEAGDIFEKVDPMLARLTQAGVDEGEKFNNASFGTIAHICVEALLNKKEPQIPVNIAGLISPKEAETFLDAGRELAVRFLRSPLGKIAECAGLRENEFLFRTLVKNTDGKEMFINGAVDLLFDDSDHIHVVDLKTDSRELPMEHIAQMACYYQAIDYLFAQPAKKECRIWLYYLRTGHAVEMTGEVKRVKLYASQPNS
ncbi:MAG: UvrD-helicase domain-containing protein [Treponema sp.]|nr:UvrD-helicase domain-containing protein [Treponema sp.]